MVPTFLCLAYFGQHTLFLRFIHIAHEYFIPFYCQVVFFCINIPQFIYLPDAEQLKSFQF